MVLVCSGPRVFPGHEAFSATTRKVPGKRQWLVILDFLLLPPIRDTHCFFCFRHLFSGNWPFPTPTFLHSKVTLGTTLKRLLTQTGPPEFLPQNLQLEVDASHNLASGPKEIKIREWLVAISYHEDCCEVWERMGSAENLSVTTEDTCALKETHTEVR